MSGPDAGGEFRELVAGHLARYPGSALSAYELMRTLGLSRTKNAGTDRVRRALEALEGQGRVVRVAVPVSEYTGRPATRWRVA